MSGSPRTIKFAGIRNQGATCYLNSLLQTLFHLTAFRKAIYGLPTAHELSDVKPSIPLALQRLFYALEQFSEAPSTVEAVDTDELTKAFGWNSRECFVQHDIQELVRLLLDRLSTRAQQQTKQEDEHAPSQDIFSRLMVGRLENYISCTDIDYQSTKEEPFADLNLPVAGLGSVGEALLQYVQAEVLEGDNSYEVEDGNGMRSRHPANKGVRFVEFPPVLFLHLKRFDYDFHANRPVKVRSRFEYSETLDVAPFLAQPEEDRTEYRLHSVLVHSGNSCFGGHYYAFIHAEDGEWYKFDDLTVTRVTTRDVVENNFGGEERAVLSTAYLLVYVRVRQWAELTSPTSAFERPDHLRDWYTCEQEERERRAREEHERTQQILVRIATDASMRVGAPQPCVRFPDATPALYAQEVRLDKAARPAELLLAAAHILGAQPNETCIWWLDEEGSRSAYPSSPHPTWRRLETHDEYSSLDHLFNAKKPGVAETRCVFATPRPVGSGAALSSFSTALVWVKEYDPEHERLTLLGARVIDTYSSMAKVRETVAALLDPPAEPQHLKLGQEKGDREYYEMYSYSSLSSFGSCGIIVVQRPLGDVKHRRPTAESYFKYLRNRRSVVFCNLDEPNEIAFEAELEDDMGYTQIQQAIAPVAGAAPAHIQLTRYSAYNDAPSTHPIQITDTLMRTLKDMISQNYGQFVVEKLYFKVMHESVTQLQSRSEVLYIRNSSLSVSLFLELPPSCTVDGLLARVRAEVCADEPDILDAELRVFEVLYGNNQKVHRVMGGGETLSQYYMKDYRVIRAPRQVLDADGSAVEGQQLCGVNHFNRPTDTDLEIHSTPFLVYVTPHDTGLSVRERIRELLEVERREFDRWGLYILASYTATPVGNDAILFEVMGNSYSAMRGVLGLEHARACGTTRPQGPAPVLRID
eukprot:TRINITY_DN10256_c0_g2_i1.p1 TRINITY_DN10256_c0_g2~~TRINITY_DN10256_c0_g2_i1.p1  ORF type:complete len:930 (-),score=183.14 TRINITY_DN10256_c0_g2_i1:135-2900(-)